MSLLLIIGLVLVLYLRTLKYKYVIDDIVKRDGYMYDVPLTSPPPDFFKTRPSVWYRLFMIGMHCVNVTVVYLLWGWCPALLFAVHPLSVWGTAWVTGNYYATATYFTLIAYFIIHNFPNVWGALVAMPIYAAALNSTVCPITFPFFFIFTGQPWGLTMFIPLAIFLTGKRFTQGIKIRKNINNDKVFRDKSVKLNYFRRIAVMTRVVAKYIYVTLYPDRLGFFDGFGRKLKENPQSYNLYHSFSLGFWASLAVCLSVFIAGMLINPTGILWFFTFVMLHSQWNLMGQFFAQRYLYLALPGMCIVVGTLIQPYPVVVAVVATILVVRTHFFIPVWRDYESVWLNDVDNFPKFSQVWNNSAQFYLQVNPAPGWMMHKAAFFLHLAESMEPDSWEIQMNLACFYAKAGNVPEALRRTQLAIKFLEPLGGLPAPLELLKKQEKEMTKMVDDMKVEYEKKIEDGKKAAFIEFQKQQGVGLVDNSLSRPATEPPAQRKEETHGQRTEEEAGVLESVGTAELAR